VSHFHLGQGHAAVILAGESDHFILRDQALGDGRTTLRQTLGVPEDQLDFLAEHTASFVDLVHGHFGGLPHFYPPLIGARG
jgi:hypothetical protein